jgi:hypothetical protein
MKRIYNKARRNTMSDGREEREEQEWRREQERRKDGREQYLDRFDRDFLGRDFQDQWEPERKES